MPLAAVPVKYLCSTRVEAASVAGAPWLLRTQGRLVLGFLDRAEVQSSFLELLCGSGLSPSLPESLISTDQ